MKHSCIFFFVLLLCTSLALASSVILDKQDYAKSDLVNINIMCTGDWLGQVRSPDNQLVHIDQGQNSKTITYNTLSSSASGKYSVVVSCQDGASITKDFCVDAPGCTNVNVVQQNPPPVNNPPSNNNNGNFNYCTSQWSCGVWGYCNATLQQAHTCFDNRTCKPPLTEVRSCALCQQSWICSLWSACASGIQSRACVDEHYCGLNTFKPALQKSCSDSFVIGPDPSQIINVPPDQFTQQYPQAAVPPIIQQPQSAGGSILSIWNQYKTWIIGAGVSLVLIIIIITLVLVLRKPKEKAYNFDELKEWIGKERELGTSDADIKQILQQQTGWHTDEVSQAFQELRSV